MSELRLRAPAKLNLGLRVIGRRADGYHELESVFVPIALADELQIALGGPTGIRLSVGGELAGGVPADARNLAWRAAERLLQAARLELGVTIALDKRVPSPAGLGGGSSDAGAVLRGLSALAGAPLAPARLAELALGLGADVPFFLAPQPALVSGIGERIQPLVGLGSLPVLLAHPGVGLETRAVYAALDAAPALTPKNTPPNLRALLGLREEAGATRARWPEASDQLRELVANDLEPAASRLSPEVAKLREELAATGARAVGMSGSGPTMYALYATESEARQAERQIQTTGRRTWLTRTLASDESDSL
ncbi:MAG TPA: 4-(cytidine 5'-diphospho)-2-C-methyl-D-erythritol kinase [Myxococcota bacterium]|nr:4-(cytidine 5'-diphospho)-2-C-methyl-D-erythritol kinase [Myxococcota bacterium]